MEYRQLGKEKLLSLGAYPAVGIAVARVKRAEAKALLIQGQDPMQSKGQSQREELATFEAVAKRWHVNRKSALNLAHAERVAVRARPSDRRATSAASILSGPAAAQSRSDRHSSKNGALVIISAAPVDIATALCQPRAGTVSLAGPDRHSQPQRRRRRSTVGCPQAIPWRGRSVA